MKVWIVFEYSDYYNEVVGVYQTYEKAKEEHSKSPTWRYIGEYEVN